MRTHTGKFIGMIEEGMDDYTTNARGDVGSLVRIQGVRAARGIWDTRSNVDGGETATEAFERLFERVLRIAGEKLDRVRVQGKMTVGAAL